MKSRFLLLALGLALLGTLLLGGAGFEGQPEPLAELPHGHGGLAALARLILGNAS
jgi:hypothetical protein